MDAEHSDCNSLAASIGTSNTNYMRRQGPGQQLPLPLQLHVRYIDPEPGARSLMASCNAPCSRSKARHMSPPSSPLPPDAGISSESPSSGPRPPFHNNATLPSEALHIIPIRTYKPANNVPVIIPNPCRNLHSTVPTIQNSSPTAAPASPSSAETRPNGESAQLSRRKPQRRRPP